MYLFVPFLIIPKVPIIICIMVAYLIRFFNIYFLYYYSYLVCSSVINVMVTYLMTNICSVLLVKSVFAVSPAHMYETAYFIHQAHLHKKANTHFKKQVSWCGRVSFFFKFGRRECWSTSYDINLHGEWEQLKNLVLSFYVDLFISLLVHFKSLLSLLEGSF